MNLTYEQICHLRNLLNEGNELMDIHEAKAKVVAWLRNGGTPTEDVPYEYDFVAYEVMYHKGQKYACAGAAIQALVEGEVTYGLHSFAYCHFGERSAFDEKIPPNVNTDDTGDMADYVEGLEVIHA